MKKLLLPFFFIGAIAMVVVMSKTGATLKRVPATPHGIVDLEFAYNTAKTSIILNAWAPADGPDNIATAKINIYWDFLFIFFYAGFLFLACKKIASKISGPVSKAGTLIAKGALAAGFLDVLENTGMLLTLNNQGSFTIAFATTVFSVIKFGLILITVLYVLTGVIALAFRRN